MNPTSTGAAHDGGRTVTAEPRSAGSAALRGAGRQVLATAGNQVLKAAVDRAVAKVDQTAGRLDAFAAGEPRPSRPRVAGTSPERAAAPGDDRRQDRAVRARIGASLSFVAQRAMLLLQLIQRLARQLLDALARLVRRARRSAADEEDEGPKSTDRPATSGNAGDVPRGPGGDPAARPARPPQPPRRRRPAPGAATAPTRRRVAGDRPDRTASE